VPFVSLIRRRSLGIVVLGVLAIAGIQLSAAQPARGTEVGLSDQKVDTWADPRVRALGLRYARLIVPWDAARSEPDHVQAWLDAVSAANLSPHIVFEHLRSDHCPGTPCVLPTRTQYRTGVDEFRARWPQVTTFTTWNEANHFTQPVADRPEAVAGYWVELNAACPGCTIVAGDVLDSQGYVRWLKRFKAAAPTMPQRWGLHNYADAAYDTTTGTDTVLATVPGELWIEETGGIVTLRDERGRITFSTSQSRAAASIDRAFAIAKARPRITRMYIYHWRANTLLDMFDAGLVNPDGTARQGLARVSANIAGSASSGVARPSRPTPQASVSAHWSTLKRNQLLVSVRCRATNGRCRGTATITAETKRTHNAKMRTTRLATGRAYRTTAVRHTATIRVTVSRSVRARIRRATSRRLAVSLTATKPAAATVDSALKLRAPAQP
jgi:hypothetical protein